MIVLAAVTTDKIQAITTGTADTTVHASYVDKISATDVTPGRTNTATIVTATTTDLVVGTATGQRNIKYLNVRNKHASAAQTVTIVHTDNTVAVELMKVTLAAGEVLTYEDGIGWYVTDASGAKKLVLAISGRFIKYTLVTSGTTFTTQPGTTKIRVRLQGGGGGGAGCTSLAAAACGAGGGGAGGYAEKVFDVAQNTAYTVAIGAAGTGVSGAAGNNGGNTTFAVGATTVTAFGGTGAPVGTAATTVVARAGGAGGVVSTNGDVNAGGAPGEAGTVLVVATPIVQSGGGGSSQFGGGGVGLVAVGNGVNGTGFGAGGGGSATGAAAVRTGGNGTAGCIIVEEYGNP